MPRAGASVHPRAHNLSGGPGALPAPVLEETARAVERLDGTGDSILGLSHRSARFRAILDDAESSCLSLLGDPPGVRALFLQGGGSLQFSMIPMHLLRGTGRTDLPGGDPHQSYRSIVDRLFTLPDDTYVYPAHDYSGYTSSTIGEERVYNPRLANRDEAAYVDLMRNLALPRPTRMASAVAANLVCGEGV